MSALQFDGEQRYRTVAEICSRLGFGPATRVLDVGGGTGGLKDRLGFSNYRSVDPAGGGPGHVQGSMDNLPFADGSFDLVLQVDALEHVPMAIREKSLEELSRVSGDVVLWLGPVENDRVVEVEEDLCQAHKDLFGGRPMEWLSQHRDYGLSEGDWVLEKLSRGRRDVTSWFSCDLFLWWALKRLDLQLEAGVYRPDLQSALDKWYSTSGWKRDYRVAGVGRGYRMVFVGRKTGELPKDLSAPPDGSDDLVEWRSILPLLEIMARPSSLSADGKPTDDTATAQLERIGRLLESGEGESDSFLKRIWGGRR